MNLKTICVLLLLSSSNILISQTMNFEAINKFWELTDYLKTDQPLTDSLWLDFYNVKGNKLYVENNISSENLADYRKSLEIVFRPSFKEKLRMEIAKNNEWVMKVNRYKDYEKEFKNFAKRMQEEDYISLMYKQAYAQLPASMRQKINDVSMYIMAIGADAAAQEKNMFFSLHIAYFFDKYIEGAIAGHELHHVLRKEYKFKKSIKEEHKGIVYVLEGILNEGVADLIDKNIVIEHNDELPQELQWKSMLLSYSSKIIEKIDSSITEIYRSNGKVFKTEEEFREILMNTSGHIPGFYMARIIARNGYHKQLIENVSNLFYFIKLYNKAAKKDKEKPALFSRESIEYIEIMNQYYKN